jgi:hypothetical protein
VDLNPTKKIAINVNVTNNICIGGNDGEIKIKIINGNSPWSYSVISGPNTTTIPNGSTTNNTLTFTNLLSGTYKFTITDSTSVVSNYTITVGSSSPLFVASSTQSTTSPTNNNGIISLATFNGNPPYTYNWTPTPPNGQNGPLITGLSIGSYSVTVTDTPVSGCSSQTFTLTGITVTAPSGLSFLTSQTNVTCYGGNDGEIVISNVTGGTTPYTYYVNGSSLGTTTIGSLNSGTYTVTVYDSISAQSSTQIITITQPTQVTATINGNLNLPCFNCTTTLSISNPTGGVPPYTFEWNTPNGSQNNNQTVSVGAGTFKWAVYDSSNCRYTGTTTVNQPSKLQINNIIVTDPLCYGDNGVTTFDVQGGTAPYTYKIFSSIPGAGYTQNGVNCTLNTNNINFVGNTTTCLTGLGSSTPISQGNVSGTVTFTTPVTLLEQYYIEVKDVNGCTVCDTFTMTSPTQLTLNLIKTEVSPGNYTILSIATGGSTLSGNYTYYLYQGSGCIGTLLSTAIDSGAHLFDNGGTGYPTGNYSVKIKDDNNCTKCVNITL